MFARIKAHTNNQLGMSLVEGLISVGAVAGLAALIATLSTQTDTEVYTLKRSCESLSQSIIESVASEGVYGNIMYAHPGFVTLTAGFGNDTILTPTLAQPLFSLGGNPMNVTTDENLWPAEVTLIGNGAAPEVNTHKLIKGSMRALNAIYNSGDVCSDYVPYPQITDTSASKMLNLELSSELFKLTTPPVVTLRLEMVDDDGFTSCPVSPAPTEIVPAGAKVGTVNGFADDSYNAGASSADGAADRYAAGPTNTLDDHGYRLSVRVEYNYKNDASIEFCEVAQTFRYPTDSTPPPTPDVPVIVTRIPDNSAGLGPADVNACQQPADGLIHAAQTLGVRIGYSGGNMEAGSILLCRDTSQWLDRDSDGGAIDQPGINRVYGDVTEATSLSGLPNRPDVAQACFQGTGSQLDAYMIAPDPGEMPAIASPFGRTYEEPMDWASQVTSGSFPYAPAAAQALNNWVPCHELRICGQDDAADITGIELTPGTWDTQSGDYTISLSWANIPTDCIVNFEMVAIDLAGNVSGTVSLDTQMITNGMLPADVASTDPRVFHRGFCGAGGVTTPQASTGNWPATVPDIGVTNQWGHYCRPPADADENTAMNWANHTITGWNGTFGGGQSSAPGGDWAALFPNGYYTCNPGGCCTDPDTGSPGTCTPYY